MQHIFTQNDFTKPKGNLYRWKNMRFNENNKSQANNPIKLYDRCLLPVHSFMLSLTCSFVLIGHSSKCSFCSGFRFIFLVFHQFTFRVTNCCQNFPTAPPVYLWHCFYINWLFICCHLCALPQCFTF